MQPKPPVAALDGEEKHACYSGAERVWKRKMNMVLKQFTLAIDKGVG